MASVNRAYLLGNLGKDPELRSTGNGTPVCSFTMATKERQGEGKEDKVEWHRIVTWGKLAETCGKYLKKGRAVFVEGRLETREWEKDGVRRSTTEIVASSVQFVGSAPEAGKTAQAGIPVAVHTQTAAASAADDYVPF